MNIIEVPSAIKHFIKHFFGCRHCSENFMKETEDIHQLSSKDKNAAIIYLWQSIIDSSIHKLSSFFFLINLVHNHVNQRLHGDETEDPQHPKAQFPSSNLCSNCRSTTNDFDLSKTLDFLLRYYSKENLDLSSVRTFSISSNNQDDSNKMKIDRKSFMEKYTMIELSDVPTNRTGFFGFIGRFPIYSLIFLVIIGFVVRKRYFKQKRKRYTL